MTGKIAKICAAQDRSAVGVCQKKHRDAGFSANWRVLARVLTELLAGRVEIEPLLRYC